MKPERVVRVSDCRRLVLLPSRRPSRSRGCRGRHPPHHEHSERREAEDKAGQGEDGRQLPADGRRQHLQGGLVVRGAEGRQGPFSGVDDGDVVGIINATWVSDWD